MTRMSFVLVLALLMPSGRAAAQTADAPPTMPSRTIGSIDLGARYFDIQGDPARDQRYRDLRSGATLDRFRYLRDRGTWLFTAAADHVGYRDQRFSVGVTGAGRMKASFEWNEIPLFNSTITSTPFTSPSPGVFRIDDAIQQGIEAGRLTLADAAAAGTTFDLRSRREIAAFRFTFSATRNLDLRFNLTSTARKGEQQWGVGLGVSSMMEVPAPLDHRTTEVGTSIEWANSHGMARIGYDGSFFRNAVQTLVMDNPLRFTDSATATSQARMALWPSSSSNAISTAGSIKFPWHSVATGSLSIGDWTQNADLIPFTINTAVAPIPLARPTAYAEARITAMNYTVTSRPNRLVWLNARYKRYDFDNRTPVFPETVFLPTDTSVTASNTGGSEPLGYVREHIDTDVSFTPFALTAFRVGYSREHVDRSFRFVETTTEHSVRGTVDIAGNSFIMFRTVFEHSNRAGTGLDEEVLDDIGEQVALRQFDISDRIRDRLSTILQVTPVGWFGVTGTVAAGTDTRPDAQFGLHDNSNRVYAVSIDVVPNDKTIFGASYGYENNETVQNSRQANPGPQFDDPTRNWSTEGFDRVHTANLSADLLNLAPRTQLRFSYDFTKSRARYEYVLPSNSTLPAVSQLPALLNELHRGIVDVDYRLRNNVTVGAAYWYDRYDVDDFALDEGTLNRLDMTPSVMLLRNAYRPYRSQTVSLRVTRRW